MPNNLCYQYNAAEKEFHISGCGMNEVCEFNQMESTGDYDFLNPGMYCRPNSYLAEPKFAGERCVVKQECRSAVCQGGICTGRNIGDLCSDYADCGVGQICFGGRCQLQRPRGSSCSHDDECTNDSLCFSGKCVEYFSQPLGAMPVTDGSVCESGYAEKGACAQAPANERDPDSECYNNDDCPLTNGEDGVCYCGMNTGGVPFCGSQPGDPEFQSYKSTFQKVLDTSVNCHYNISFSRRCPMQENNPNFSTFVTALYIYRYRPSIIGIPSCVFGVMPFALNYKYAGVSLDSDGGTSSTVVIIVSVCVFSALLLLGVICFICVRKYAIRETYEHRLNLRIASGEYAHIEFYQGQAPADPNISQTATAQFTIKDLALSEKDHTHLVRGIPVARSVDPQTQEVKDNIEEGLECASPLALKVESRVGSAAETGLFYRRESK